jgi:hypothetical protein
MRTINAGAIGLAFGLLVLSAPAAKSDEKSDSIKPGGHTFLSEAGDNTAIFGIDPVFSVKVDREYQIIELGLPGEARPIGYVLNPQDGNSALSLVLGDPPYLESDSELAKTKGFTSIAKTEGKVGGEKTTWRAWSDAEHLYADTSVSLPVRYGTQTKARVHLQVIANSAERRQALEQSLGSIVVIDPNGGIEREQRIRDLQRTFHLDGSAWSLVGHSERELTWVTKDAVEISLTIDPRTDYIPDPKDRAKLQDGFRKEAKKNHGGIVAVDTFEVSGGVCAMVIEKFPLKNLGWAYEATAIVPTHEATYLVRVRAREFGTTGAREAIAMLVLMKDRTASETETAAKEFRRDPYDRRFDADACYVLSDDPRWDKGLPQHPLTLCRATMESVTRSWSWDEKFGGGPIFRSEGTKAVAPAATAPADAAKSN